MVLEFWQMSAATRERYAQEIKVAASLRSERLVRALATVPREDYLGAAPWRTMARPAPGQMQPDISEVSDPNELYRDVAVYLDQSKNLTNGSPSTLASWLDSLSLSEGKYVFHLGCGTGYYTAVMAEMVGPSGRVVAAEIEDSLANQARANLGRYPNVQVVNGDGSELDVGTCDAILINAGATHPTAHWLSGLSTGGVLLVPMTVEFGMSNIGKGFVLKVVKLASSYQAQFLPTPVMIYSCAGVRDPEIAAAFRKSMTTGAFNSVRSLRTDTHQLEPSCWLHATMFCLSTSPST
jgi:protein-L-isoaspartate(D-aspartate) O-methyltransferase